MKKSDVVQQLLGVKLHASPVCEGAKAFAPTNIALCKYWGKRDQELNLPKTSSLSISLGNKGATTFLKLNTVTEHSIVLNGKIVPLDSAFSDRLLNFLHLFFDKPTYFMIDIESTVPIAAGLASSASGFAALTMALNTLFDWKLDKRALSILARLGSGSASRSIEQGFVEWFVGTREDGMDSYSEAIPVQWDALLVGILLLDTQEKKISSREAMQRTVETSKLYSAWPKLVDCDMTLLREAIYTNDFLTLGKTAESNALAMHATMLSSWPPICYASPETIKMMQTVWALREQGLAIYFTQDAGPNLKLLFLKKDSDIIKSYFPGLEIIAPFDIR